MSATTPHAIEVRPTLDAGYVTHLFKCCGRGILPDNLSEPGLFEFKQMVASRSVVVLELMSRLQRRGVVVFKKIYGGVFEGHVLMERGSRGVYAVRGVKAALAWMGKHLRAELVLARIPATLPQTIWIAAACGFKYAGREVGVWFKHGERHDLLRYEFSFKR